MSALSRKRRKLKFVARAVPTWMVLSAQQQRVVAEFISTADAGAAMRDEIDDPCIDNHRFAYEDDVAAMQAYQATAQNGCCGSYDRLVLINGRRAWIGCNYGH